MSLTIDRDTASRLGISPQAIDDTLYDAFGQRQVSTIFTQLNLYRVILEVKPEFQQNPDALAQIYVRDGERRPGAAQRLRHDDADRRAALHHAPGAVPRGHALVQPRRPASRSATRSTAIERARRRASTCRPASTPTSRARPRPSATRWPASRLLILAALITVYIVLGVLYESYIHPITILSTLPSAGVGALLALMRVPDRVQRHRAHRHHPAHRHREEERAS